jgi:hypothetical protein
MLPKKYWLWKKLAPDISDIEVIITPVIASTKLMIRMIFNFSLSIKEAKIATNTGIVNVIIPALAAMVNLEPSV